MSEKQLFYKELKKVVKESYIQNKGLKEGHQIRIQIETDVQKFIQTQTITKRVNKGDFNKTALSYIIGEVIYELDYKGETPIERKKFILNMAQYICDMFSLGKNSMSCADVFICINNQNHWLEYLN